MQSALLEVMQERQVTIGHTTYPVPEPFLVMATQNPIESEGTYPLPEAQIDRFMLKVVIDYPEHDEELTIVQRQLVAPPELRQALSLEDLRALPARRLRRLRRPRARQLRRVDSPPRRAIPRGTASDDLKEYISFGASPRGPISLVQASRALALVRGRDYVLAEDLQVLAKDALRHRLVLTYQALAEEVNADAILDTVLATVPVPQIDLARRTPREPAACPPRPSRRRRGPGPGPMPDALLRALDVSIGRRVEGLLAGDYRSTLLGDGHRAGAGTPLRSGRRCPAHRLDRDCAHRRASRARAAGRARARDVARARHVAVDAVRDR